jgi:hypothetical protein
VARKKKKRMDRGETGFYDADRAAQASNAADQELNRMVSKKTGIDPFKKRKRGS